MRGYYGWPDKERRTMPPPKPGSDEARKQGCTCPVLDNKEMSGELYWMDLSCPVHGREGVMRKLSGIDPAVVLNEEE